MDKNRIRFWQADGLPAGTLESHPTCDPTTPKRPARTFAYRPPSTTSAKATVAHHPLRRWSDRSIAEHGKLLTEQKAAKASEAALPSPAPCLALAQNTHSAAPSDPEHSSTDGFQSGL